MRRVQSSRVEKLDELFIHLTNVLIRRKEENIKIKLKKVCFLGSLLKVSCYDHAAVLF